MNCVMRLSSPKLITELSSRAMRRSLDVWQKTIERSGIDAGREEHGRARQRRLVEPFWFVRGRDRVQVDDAEDGVALLLGCCILAVAAE